MAYRIGLDIGLTTVGWAAVAHDKDETPTGILAMGVRAFDAGEKAEGKNSCKERQKIRNCRRKIRRRKFRLQRTRELLLSFNVLSKRELDTLYSSYIDIYKIRYEALNRMLYRDEWAKLLIHLMHKRGYNDSPHIVADAKIDYAEIMKNRNYQTVGEMFFKDEKFRHTAAGNTNIRIKNTLNDYKFIAPRSLLISEIKQVFAAQCSRGNLSANDRLENEYLKIFEVQRDFDDGPGENSPYKIKCNIWGNCAIYKNEMCAPKSAYFNEYFMLLNNLNNISVFDAGGVRNLIIEEREMLIKSAHSNNKITVEIVAEITGANIVDIYLKNESFRVFDAMPAYHKIKRAVESAETGAAKKLSAEQFNEISKILAIEKGAAQKKSALSELGIAEALSYALSQLSFFMRGYLSEKAIKEVIPHLEQGHKFSKACSLAFKTVTKNKKNKLSMSDCEENTTLGNRRALSQTIKVINAIVRTYGRPQKVVLSFRPDIKFSYTEKKEKEEARNKVLEQNRAAYSYIKNSFDITPTGNDLLKYRLWQEQKGMCFYSGKKINFKDVMINNNCEIDHIIPYSKSFDDSLSNKLLVRREENKNKSNKLAYEFVKTNTEKLQRYEHLVNGIITDRKKKHNLLRERYSKPFTAGHQETRTLFRIIRNLIKDNLKMETAKNKKYVVEADAAVTYLLKKKLLGNTEESDVTNASHAFIAALCEEKYIKIISDFLTALEKNELGIESFPLPWENMEKEFYERVSKVFVSKMPKRKTTGRAHKDTIKSDRQEGYAVTKVDLSRLKLNHNSGELENYYKPETDSRLYNALKKRLEEYRNDAYQAFIEPFYKPKSDGTNGPLVKKVKLIEKATLGVTVRAGKGVAANGNMIRIDVFNCNGKYFFVPIYVSDTVKEKLPERAVLAHKEHSVWVKMNDKDFIFSLYPHELVRVTHRKGLKLKNIKDSNNILEIKEPQLLYYQGANISSGTLNMITHDRLYHISGLGLKTLENFEKISVDVLGNYYPEKIPQERQRFNRKNKKIALDNIALPEFLNAVE